VKALASVSRRREVRIGIPPGIQKLRATTVQVPVIISKATDVVARITRAADAMISARSEHDGTAPQVFTPRRYWLRVGVSATVLFCLALVVSGVGISFEVASGRLRPLALVLPFLWLPFIALGVWVVLSYYRTSIRLMGDDLRFQGVLTTWTIRLPEVVRIRWHLRPLLKVYLGTGKRRIEYGAFRRGGYLLEYFRTIVAHELQENWCEPLEQSLAKAGVEMSSDEYNRKWRRTWRILAPWAVPYSIWWIWLGLQRDAPLQFTTGSLAVDWFILGLLSLGLPVAGAFWMKWAFQPE
jgi:hypothetical protein